MDHQHHLATKMLVHVHVVHQNQQLCRRVGQQSKQESPGEKSAAIVHVDRPAPRGKPAEHTADQNGIRTETPPIPKEDLPPAPGQNI